MTHINEPFDPPKRQPGVVHEPSEDTLLSRRVLTGKYFYFELVFFSAAWLVGVVSIGYSMFTMHRIMYTEKKQRIRELEDEMQEIIENPYDITESTVTDEGELEDIRRRLDEVRATRVYPATFTMWSQIAISVLLPQVMQLGVQATL